MKVACRIREAVAGRRGAVAQYRRDPTHVVFYREETLRQIAKRRGWTWEIPVKDVALMRKPPEASWTT